MYSLSISLEAALLIKVLSCYSAQIISLLATAPLRSAVSWARFLAHSPLSAFVRACMCVFFFLSPLLLFHSISQKSHWPIYWCSCLKRAIWFPSQENGVSIISPLRGAQAASRCSLCSQIPWMKALPSHLGKSEITSCIQAVSSWKMCRVGACF